MNKHEKGYIISVLSKCLDIAYRTGDIEMQQEIEICINILSKNN